MKFYPIEKNENNHILLNPRVNKPIQRNEIMQTSSRWKWKDYAGEILARTTSSRNTYRVKPGLYRLGNPDADSHVLVSANYKLSFDKLRKNLKNQNLWILVLDTKGINVWCAAGKGTFGTNELLKQIKNVNLDFIVHHRKIILPQLGAPGVRASEVKKKSGFNVIFGPVFAKDIIEFLNCGLKATDKMRRVYFSISDRAVLTPMEIVPLLKYFPWFALPVMIIFGLEKSGILFHEAIFHSVPYLISGIASIFAGAMLTPILLPYLPAKAFSIKGWIVGLMAAFALSTVFNWWQEQRYFLLAFVFVFVPMMSSFIALQFTGSTTYTSMSGVKKELRYALPVYKVSAALSVLLLVIEKIHLEGFL